MRSKFSEIKNFIKNYQHQKTLFYTILEIIRFYHSRRCYLYHAKKSHYIYTLYYIKKIANLALYQIVMVLYCSERYWPYTIIKNVNLALYTNRCWPNNKLRGYNLTLIQISFSNQQQWAKNKISFIYHYRLLNLISQPSHDLHKELLKFIKLS